MIRGIIFDLDQTLIDSKIAREFRDNRQWSEVYKLIPRLNSYPLIDEVIHLINSKKIKIAIVTSSPKTYVQKILEIKPWSIDTIVAYHDTSKRKPHPDPMLLATSKLQLKKEDVVSFGDDPKDIQSSKSAGIYAVACYWDCDSKEKLKLSNPDYELKTTNELKLYIHSISS